MHDPRRQKPPSSRDIEALNFIGEGYEVAQYQLHAAVFPKVSAVVVSHFVTRAVRNRWIAVERWNRVGINRLRLTPLGRDAAVAGGCDAKSLFVPKRPVATKDVAHTLWINDVRVAFGKAGIHLDAVLPAWQLQRRMSPPPAAVPDVLAISRTEHPRVIACEVDLGGERLRSVFLPKLVALDALLAHWSDGERTATIVVFTTTQTRREQVEAFGAAKQLALRAVILPPRSGVHAIEAISSLLKATTLSSCRKAGATNREREQGTE